MALIKCPECSSEISDQATHCTKCGWRPANFKWWLWIPLGLLVFLLMIVISYNFQPEYKKEATQARDICKKISFDHAECDRIYNAAIKNGELLEKQKANEKKLKKGG